MKILVIDDDEAIRESLDLVLRFEHHDVLLAPNGEEGLKSLRDDPTVDMVFLDIKMPGRDGLEVLPDIVADRADLPVVMISGHGTIETAMEATRRGAFDFIEKPLDRDRVLLTVRNAHQARRLVSENTQLRERLSDTSRRMLGNHPKLDEVRSVIEKVAPTPARVLIQGENGSGKELVARLVHEMSDRNEGPFVDVNCAAIPKELLESELFGHEKGAFTGATEQRKGKFEQADGGTLFLDEVGDMSLEAQAKVLRVIEEQKVQRVGGADPIPVDVRLVAATNKDLKEASEEHTFREDLYYRLAVVPIRVPPLRERRSDVPILAKAFLDQFATNLGQEKLTIADPAQEWLSKQDWPGNVRQLRNLMERCAILCDGPVLEQKDLDALTSPSASSEGVEDLFRSTPNFESFKHTSEKLYLQFWLAENEWNVKRTAEMLGMQRSNLYKKIDRYQLK
ncbi:MAG: sigma-54 dependent transcriptional regulator [Planctomycetota bacterium]|nr:sigma-54 dependent transcriptional regulator [Planctomycetota bacterium]